MLLWFVVLTILNCSIHSFSYTVYHEFVVLCYVLVKYIKLFVLKGRAGQNLILLSVLAVQFFFNSGYGKHRQVFYCVLLHG